MTKNRLTRTILAMTLLATASLAESRLDIYLNVEPNTGGAVQKAQAAVADAFASAGVATRWPSGRPSRDQLQDKTVIVVNIVEDSNPNFRPGVLAWTDLCEGVHITVYWDRIVRRKRPAAPAAVLANVLVHELTHVLQGIDWHADQGVMKAQWSVEDYRSMSRGPLLFTPFDLELIRIGLARRSGEIAAR